MRIVAVAFALALLAAPLRAEDAPWSAEQTAVAIPMRDKASLAADVFLPPTPGRYPAVVIQTPYDRTLMRAALRGGGERGFWDRSHYAYVVVDWRGFFGSKNAGRAGAGRRGLDGFDVVEWTAAQPWCDGKVGTWGPSALGRIQIDTAQEAPPHLVCCVPLVAPIGQRYEDYYEGGVFKEAHVQKLDALGFAVAKLVRAAPLPRDPLWVAALSFDHAERIDVPLFFITGWYDHATANELDSFIRVGRFGRKAREGSRLLVGPWDHVSIDQAQQGDVAYPAAAGEAARETRLFFDAHLRAVGVDAWAARPRVRLWRCGEDGWSARDELQPHGPGGTRFTLHSDGTIDERPAAADEPPRGFVDDPASPVPTIGGANLPAKGLLAGPRDQTPLLARDDVLVFTTPPLAAALRLEGMVELRATLRIDRPDADVAVRLCDLLADGRTMLVADAIHRAQFRDPQWRREAVEPGRAFDLVVTLPPIAYTVPKGGRLRVIVSGTNWPRFERNPHTGELHFDPAKSAPAKVEVLAASLMLPLLPPAEPAAPAPK